MLADSTIQVYNVQKAIESRRGPLHESLDIHGEIQLLSGRAKNKIDQALAALIGDTELRTESARKKSNEASIIGRANEDGIVWKDLAMWMYAKHAPERNAAVKKKIEDEVNKKFKDPNKRALELDRRMTERGSGMTDLQAAKIVSDLQGPSGNRAALYDKYAKEVSDLFVEPMRNLMVEAELMSEEEVNDLRNLFGNYVPLDVLAYTGKNKNRTPSSQRNLALKGKAAKRIVGTDQYTYENRVDPISGLVNRYKSIAIQAERNMMLKKVAKLIQENPHEMWDVQSTKNIPVLDKETGDVKSIFEIAVPEKNGIAFREKGKLKYIILRDGDLFNAFDVPSIHHGARWFMRYLQSFQQFRRTVLTTFNPEFIPANFVRDILTGLTLIDAYVPVRGAKKKMVMHIPGAMAAIRRVDMGIENAGQMDVYLREAIAAGGDISWIKYDGADQMLDSYDRLLSAERKRNEHTFRQTKIARIGKSGAKRLFNTAMIANRMAEQSVRLSAYATARESGMSEAQAALVMKNVTVNFNKKGVLTPYLNTLFLFSNAGIQGSLNMMDSAIRSPKVRQNLVAVMGVAMMVQMMNYLIGDDENEKVSDKENRNQMYMNLGGGNSVKLPLGYGMNVPKVLGDQIFHVMAGKKGIVPAFNEVMMATEATFNPFGGGEGIANSFVPDILSIPLEISTNTTYGGIPIVPENPYGYEIPASKRYFKSVSEPSKWFTKWLSEATGGHGDVSGAIEVSPEYIDYGIAYIFGGVGKTVLNSIDAAQSAVAGDFDINKMPIARRFFEDMKKIEYRDSQIFYNAHKGAGKREYNEHMMKMIGISYKEMLSRATTKGARSRVTGKMNEILELQNARKAGPVKSESQTK
jgi:hypothetical protein